jgi:hypothetical protein
LNEPERQSVAIAPHLLSYIEREGVPLEQAIHDALELWRRQRRQAQVAQQYGSHSHTLLDPEDFDEQDYDDFLTYLE